MEFWNKTDKLTYPSGRTVEPAEVFEEFPFTKTDDVVINFLDAEKTIVGSIDSLEVLKDIFNVDKNLKSEDALIQIQKNREEQERKNAMYQEIVVDERQLRADVDYLLMLQE